MKKGTIIFDKDLNTIGKEAFKDCENLASITIPKKVNSILASAFQNCINLKEINYKGSSSDFKNIKFEANWNDNTPAEYVYCSDTSVRVKYNYLTFTALEDNCSIGFYNNPDSSVNPTIEYSFDKINWYKLTDNVSIENGSNTYCRGLNPNGISGGYDEGVYNYFIGEGRFNVSGDIMSLIDYNVMPETMVGTLFFLFGRNEEDYVDVVDASKLILSAKVLTSDCYQRMFDSCISMTRGPQIKAEVLAPYCYQFMFNNCTSLTTAPELPATELVEGCYEHMFEGCTSLTTAPELPATELVEGCYEHMFEGCTSLTTAPELPATELADYCYAYMFYNCQSLTAAPELPATELADYCYDSMFYNCQLLTAAPELSATTLAPYCCQYMFQNCTSLTTVPELPATVLVKGCYQNMFEDCESLNYIKCLATDISANSCTSFWVSNVSNTGIFIKHPDAIWSTGESGIPSGWTIKSEEVVDDEKISFEVINPTEKNSTQNGIQVESSNNIQTNKTFDNKTDVSIYKVDSNPLNITSDSKNISKIIFTACYNSTSNEKVTEACAVSVSEDGDIYSYLNDVQVIADGTITGTQGIRVEQTNTDGIGVEGYDGFTQVTVIFNDLYKYVRIEKDGKETWVNSLIVYTKD